MKKYTMPEEGYIDQDSWPPGQYVRFEECKQHIMILGERADTCVYDTLKQVCDYCRCKRKKSV